MSHKYAKVTFVDADPSISSVRAQELLRSKARSHAARISHPSSRKPRPQTQPRGSTPRTQISPALTNKPGRDDSQDRDDHGDNRLNHQPDRVRFTLPMHKGNSDPFNATAVPYTPLEYAMVKWSRSMQIVTAWPSDVKMRQNMPQMLNAGRVAIGNLVDDAATIHAFISYSCLHWYAMGRQNQATSLDPRFVTIAKKHSSLALRQLHEMVRVQNVSQSRQGLENVRNAATWLAASNIYSGNLGEAHLHFSAAMKLVDMMGGLKSLPDAESGLMIHAIIGLSMMMRSRPIIEPDEFDPGPWCEQGVVAIIPESEVWYGDRLSRPPSPPRIDLSRPSTASAMQKAIFAEMRELLLVEEYKVKNALSKSDATEQVFRWSHFRKLAVRARNVHYWCDLVEMHQNSSPTSKSDSSPSSAPGPLADNFDTCLIHATRLFDRCIFEEQYSPKGPFPLSKGNYMQLLAGLGHVRTKATPSETRLQRYDMLWMASAGAYFEDTFLQQRFAVGAGPGVTYFFAPMFTALVNELGFDGLEDVSAFLARWYLYCPRLQDETMKKLIVPKRDAQDAVANQAG